jgi:hypothetical protein
LADLNFTAAEVALVAYLIANVTEFTAENTKAADFDSVYNYALSTAGVDYFAWTEFAGAENKGRGIWGHRVDFTVGILFQTSGVDMNANIRTIVDAVTGAVLPDTNLSGAVSSASISTVSSPVPVQNIETSVPHVEITFGFTVEQMMAIGSRRC